MTPQREIYLKQCSIAEQFLRGSIAITKREIKQAKDALNNNQIIKPTWDRTFWKGEIKAHNILLSMYRHELNRLKGMDRVVVPRISYIGNDIYLQKVERCSCGERLMGEIYCPNCGRRLLWESVK